MATGLMHHGLESAAQRFADHAAVLAGDDRWTYAELDRAANALARHLAGHGVGPGDRVAVMTSNRPEFVVRRHRGAASSAPRRCCSTRPGRRSRSTRALRPHRTPLRAWPTGPASPCWPSSSARGRRARPRRAGGRGALIDRASSAPPPVGAVGADRRRGPRLQLRDDRPPQGGPPHARVDRLGNAALGHARWASAPTTASRSRRRPRTSSACSTCWPRPRRAPRSGCTAASTSTRSCAASRRNA